jgi:hypothetical protein
VDRCELNKNKCFAYKLAFCIGSQEDVHSIKRNSLEANEVHIEEKANLSFVK